METLYAQNGTLYLYQRPVKTIHFYNDTGVIHSCSSTIYDENNEAISRLEVLQVLKTDKTFKKEETEQEFIQKQMKKKINFSYMVKKSYSWDDDKRILYLYVDNEYIKVLEQKDRIEVGLFDYSLSRGYTYINDITLEIDGKVIFDYLDSKDTKDKPGRFVVYIPSNSS